VKILNSPIRIYRIIKQLLFWYFHKSSFKSLSRNVRFVSPFRLDGGDGVTINNGTFFQRGVWLYCCGIDGVKASLSIGKSCVFGYNNHITCVEKVTIGDFVLTANNVYISDNAHGYKDIHTPVINQPVEFTGEVEIGAGSWIGENACIIGVKVGKNCVIGANAVVLTDIPDYSVAVGIPAVVIKRYDLESDEWVRVPRV
jgi:acetyltransferase-like isoleucine patch superfamily enzyme